MNDKDKTICMFGGGVECFADGESDKQNVRLKLYDGGITKHWYWGNLAFDVKTMKLAKKTVPILIDHDTSQRAGIGTKAIKDEGFVLEGRFLKSSLAAQEVRDQSSEGYPFEASLRFDMAAAKVVQVGENATHQINGKTLEGPGAAIYNTRIMEGSIVTFGALSNCATEVFENQNMKGSNMADKSEMTLEAFKADHTDLYSKVFSDGKAEGEKSERDLAASIFAVCPDSQLAYKSWQEGKTADAAKMAYLEAENIRLAAEKDAAVEAAKKAAMAKSDPDAMAKSDPDAAAKLEFSDKSDAHKTNPSQLPTSDMTDDELRAKYKADPKLRAEFRDVENYVAYTRADDKGLVGIKGK